MAHLLASSSPAKCSTLLFPALVLWFGFAPLSIRYLATSMCLHGARVKHAWGAKSASGKHTISGRPWLCYPTELGAHDHAPIQPPSATPHPCYFSPPLSHPAAQPHFQPRAQPTQANDAMTHTLRPMFPSPPCTPAPGPLAPPLTPLTH